MSGCVLTLLLLVGQFAPGAAGELRLAVTDGSGLPLPSGVELVSESNHFRERYTTDSSGTLIAKRVPFGTYRVVVSRDGFAAFSGIVEVRSALPTLA